MDCKTAQGLVMPYIRDGLDDRQTEEFLKHVFTCEECFEELEIFYTVHFAVQRLEEDGQVSYNMRDMLWQDLRAAQHRLILKKFLHYVSYGIMLAAEVLLAVLLVTGSADLQLFTREEVPETETVSGLKTETETETGETQAAEETETEEKTEEKHG